MLFGIFCDFCWTRKKRECKRRNVSISTFAVQLDHSAQLSTQSDRLVSPIGCDVWCVMWCVCVVCSSTTLLAGVAGALRDGPASEAIAECVDGTAREAAWWTAIRFRRQWLPRSNAIYTGAILTPGTGGKRKKKRQCLEVVCVPFCADWLCQMMMMKFDKKTKPKCRCEQ